MTANLPAKKTKFDDFAVNANEDFVTMMISDQLFGIPVLQVQDVLGNQRITRIPLAPPEVAGSLNLCEAGEDFDVIISDIEMPGMSGFEFAQATRGDTRWHSTPLVALSSHASPRDLDRGRQAGFTDYVAKFDRDALLFTLSQTLSETKGAA